jgi:hypothetical protein
MSRYVEERLLGERDPGRLASNVGGMGSLSFLTREQIAAISAAP